MKGKVELWTLAFFPGGCSEGKHQYKNKLFLGPQYLSSVNASESYFMRKTHSVLLGHRSHPAGGIKWHSIVEHFPAKLPVSLWLQNLYPSYWLKQQKEHDLIFQIPGWYTADLKLSNHSFPPKVLWKPYNFYFWFLMILNCFSELKTCGAIFQWHIYSK